MKQLINVVGYIYIPAGDCKIDLLYVHMPSYVLVIYFI